MSKRWIFLILLGFLFILSSPGFATPIWSTNQSDTPLNYLPTYLSEFNVTWTGNVSTVLIEINYTGSPNNYTMTNDTYTGDIWNYSIILPAGTFQWKSYANNTTDSWNSTDTWIVTISPNSTNPVNLYINGSLNQNVTISSGTSNATGVAVYSNSGTLYLYRDGVQKATGTGSINETTTLTSGTSYAYKVNITGNANYSSNSTGLTYYLTVGTLADGSSCTENNQCSGGYCVHNICRSTSTYCGDTYCDSGESCSSCPLDCGICSGDAGLPYSIIITTKDEATISVPSIAAGKMANVIVSKTYDVDFRQLNISVINSVNNLRIIIKKLAGLPADVTQEITGKVYHYINVTKRNIEDTDMNKVYIKFAVNKSWITDNNVDSATIILYRWSNYQWNPLTTSKVSEDSEEIFYQAESPGLSYFVIGELEVGVAPPTCEENWSCTDWSECVNGTQTRTCTDLNDCGTTINEPAESQSCGEGGIAEVPVGWSGWTIGTIISVIIIVVAIVLVYIQRKKIFHKKKPSKEKVEYYYSKLSKIF